MFEQSNSALYMIPAQVSLLTYPSDNAPYPCTSWDNVIYYSESKLTLQTRNGVQDTLKLPFGNLTYGKCVQTGNYPTFIGSSADEKTFIVPINGTNSRIVSILNSNCFKGSSTCHKPVFSENEQVFGVFDSATNTL